MNPLVVVFFLAVLGTTAWVVSTFAVPVMVALTFSLWGGGSFGAAAALKWFQPSIDGLFLFLLAAVSAWVAFCPVMESAAIGTTQAFGAYREFYAGALPGWVKPVEYVVGVLLSGLAAWRGWRWLNSGY